MDKPIENPISPQMRRLITYGKMLLILIAVVVGVGSLPVIFLYFSMPEEENSPPAFLVREPFVFDSGGLVLQGELILPGGADKLPGVVVLGGSDWRTRDQVRGLADIFVSHQVAAVIFDKRGSGLSQGSTPLSMAESAADAVAALKVLQKHPRIRADRAGLVGASRGGWMVAQAAGLTRPGFAVLLSAPAVPPKDQERMRVEHTLRADGFSEADIEDAAEAMSAKFAYASEPTQDAWDRYATALAEGEGREWMDYIGGPRRREADWRWLQINAGYDPMADLSKLACPVLAVFGEKDQNVLPRINAPLLEEALHKTGRDDWRIEVLPDLNHSLQAASTGGRRDRTSARMSPEVSRTIGDWLDRHVR